MKCNFLAFISIILLVISLGGVIGSCQILYSQKDVFDAKIISLEKENDITKQRMYDLNAKVSSLQTSIDTMKEDVRDIKNIISKFFFLTLGICLSSFASGGTLIYATVKKKKQ